MEDFKDQVKKGFRSCKSDIELVSNQNKQLQDKLFLLEQENRNLKEELSKNNSDLSELKAEIKGLSIAMEIVKNLIEKQPVQTPQTQTLQTQNPQTSPIQTPTNTQTLPPQQSIEIPINQPKRDPYEALLAFKAKKNKREVLKQKMKSMIGESGMSLSELKFMFVEHFKYCSKASFYNYLKELEIEKSVKIQRQNTQNVVFLETDF
ncbi:MAG: hypothetical protein ACOCXG_01835 [Nanoarchaeota archaeon]